ncbi:MAG: type IV pilus assembly protein PilE [Lysobacterales bacterium]|jgi:type IV pilus assembly protein PilE
MKYTWRGFSLMELMIVVALAAILLGLSVPTYQGFVRKSTRAEAVVTLLDWANRQDVWRADNASYNLNISPAADTNYAYSMVANNTSFTLTATSQGRQTNDKEKGVACSVMTINQAGVTGPVGHEACWSH